MFSYETASQYFKPHSIISALQYSYYHRSNGINVYGSDINTDVYCSDVYFWKYFLFQNGASNNFF